MNCKLEGMDSGMAFKKLVNNMRGNGESYEWIYNDIKDEFKITTEK